MNYIGKNLEWIIKTNFKNRQSFCEKYNCSEVQLSRYINGVQIAKLDWLYMISKDFNINLSDMYDKDLSKTSNIRKTKSDNSGFDIGASTEDIISFLHNKNLHYESLIEDKVIKKITVIEEMLNVILRSNSKILLENADFNLKYNELLEKIDKINYYIVNN